MALVLLLVVATLFLSERAMAQTGRGGSPAGPPSTPAVVDLRAVPAGGISSRTGLPRRHPGGEAELNQSKAAVDPAAAPSDGSTAAPFTLSAGVGFDGIDSSQSGCGCLPPDGAIAAGPSRVVAAVNTAFSIWDKSGNPVAGYPKVLSSLFTNANCLANISDPFAEYDRTSNRFMVGALTYDASNNSSVCIAVSQTDDPTTTWEVYGFPVSPAADLFDFPHATIGATAIYVTGNQFQGGTTFTGARVYAYNKADMYAGLPTAPVFVDVGNNAAGKVADTVMPARGAGSADTAYFIAADNSACPCSNVSVWTWSDPFGASSFALQGGVGVTSYGQPPNALQLGGHGPPGQIATNDAGDLAAYFYRGSLYGAHTIASNPGSGTVAAVQWYQLGNIDGVPTLVQQGIAATNGEYRYFPNLSVDTAGNMTLAYAFSSGAQYAGVRYRGRLASDAAGTLAAEGVLKAGQATINGSRYGDYAGAAVDPDGCTVWHFEEYARAGSLWGTWAGSLRAAECESSVGGIAEAPILPALRSEEPGGQRFPWWILLSAVMLVCVPCLYLLRRLTRR